MISLVKLFFELYSKLSYTFTIYCKATLSNVCEAHRDSNEKNIFSNQVSDSLCFLAKAIYELTKAFDSVCFSVKGNVMFRTRVLVLLPQCV